MYLRKSIGKSFVLIVALVYLIFSCGYVSKCLTLKERLSLLKKETSVSQNIIITTKSDKTDTSGKFSSRPRVVSQGNKSFSINSPIIILSWLAASMPVKQEYFHFLLDAQNSYASNILEFLGNRRI